ncbi:hypothetical protein AB833_18905 [Chromatiales bacterium (ex Bugula neritina AB1)]|nr:hypothetical protein AB833_18905 [Chromatiales bacterium (ex Bugula neritina AB1)]
MSASLLAATATVSTSAFAELVRSRAIASRNLRKLLIRAETKQSDTAPSGAFAKQEVDGLLFLTNAYGYSYQIPEDSYIEWHLDNTNTVMKFRCVNSDQYRVKAFPCAVLGTMGGRWETAGKLEPLAGMENEYRMKGEGMQSPLFDLRPARKKTGFPCLLSELPETTVQAKTRYHGNPTVNTFLDMYLHDIDNPETASHSSLTGDLNALNSNRTKAYNINVWFQMPDHPNGNSGRPDDAWAGGKVIGVTDIAGQPFHVILKIETGGGNYFRYIALIPVNGPITHLSVNAVMDWAKQQLRPMLENHPQAQEMMAKPDPRGYPAPRWPDDNMVLSGLHLGNEIWWSDPNGQEGQVHWDTLQFDVAGHGSFGWGGHDEASSGNRQSSTQSAEAKTSTTRQQTQTGSSATNPGGTQNESVINTDPAAAVVYVEPASTQAKEANSEKPGLLQSIWKSIFD